MDYLNCFLYQTIRYVGDNQKNHIIYSRVISNLMKPPRKERFCHGIGLKIETKSTCDEECNYSHNEYNGYFGFNLK